MYFSNLCKASREVGFAHHRDISHSFGAFLERTYKEDVDFNSFMKSMGETKERKSPNKNFGVTSFVLTIPLHTKLRQLDDVECFGVKQRMEATKINDVKEWKREKTTPKSD